LATNLTPGPQLSVVIPVYNERDTIEEILRRIQAIDIEKEILIVHDGSTDGTREFLADLAAGFCWGVESTPLPEAGNGPRSDSIRVFFQEKNCGKGAALRRGFKEAREWIVVIQDADLEYDPRDYFALIQPIQGGQADIVDGSRFLGGPHRVLLFWH
jgi:glycosyltransferase involved in cell wall biosynthesis